MAKIPPSTQTSLQQRLTSHARARWPQISQIHTRCRAGFAYIDATLTDEQTLPLCRLRYGGSAHQWGFAIYRASHEDYDDSYLPSGYPVGSAEEALDTACGLYLNDPTAWTGPPTN
jgi:choline dehydrogenase-like flavoprotein